MPFEWGPRCVVPTKVLKANESAVRLQEDFDEVLLEKELKAVGVNGRIVRVTNPWYYRKKGDYSWIRIGESDDKSRNFAVNWETRNLKDGQYEVLGLMHVFIKQDDREEVIAGQNITEVKVSSDDDTPWRFGLPQRRIYK
jgi:hypothetical protein